MFRSVDENWPSNRIYDYHSFFRFFFFVAWKRQKLCNHKMVFYLRALGMSNTNNFASHSQRVDRLACLKIKQHSKRDFTSLLRCWWIFFFFLFGALMDRNIYGFSSRATHIHFDFSQFYLKLSIDDFDNSFTAFFSFQMFLFCYLWMYRGRIRFLHLWCWW